MGVGRIAEKMAEGVRSRGGVVHLSTEVVALHHRNEHIHRIDALHHENLLKVETEAVVSSMPITGLVHRLRPPAPNEVLQAAARLKFRNQIQVTLFLNNETRLPDNWVYVQDKMIPFTRFTIAHNFSRDLSPDGKTSVVFEVPCDEGDAVWKESDEAVLGLVRDHFIRHFGSLVEVKIIGTHVLRVEKEYPVFELGYRRYLDIITRYLSRFSNLQFIGRNGSFRYKNMDQSIMMGLRAARHLLGEHFNKNGEDPFGTDDGYLEEKAT